MLTFDSIEFYYSIASQLAQMVDGKHKTGVYCRSTKQWLAVPNSGRPSTILEKIPGEKNIFLHFPFSAIPGALHGFTFFKSNPLYVSK